MILFTTYFHIYFMKKPRRKKEMEEMRERSKLMEDKYYTKPAQTATVLLSKGQRGASCQCGNDYKGFP